MRKVVRWFVTALVALLLVSVFYLAVILGQPQESENAVQVDLLQPLLSASPAVTITAEAELQSLLDSFPVPVLHAMSGSGLTLLSGSSYDQAYGSGFARIAQLVYQSPAGLQMTVTSIYPARALEMLGKDEMHIASTSGQALAGMASVRMESDTVIRLHAQSENGLYAVTVPMMDTSDLTELIRSLQLSSP